ncbi:MAG: hypothetical protein GWM90_23115, partial [Gemmatimonadetes bacterium]|nr:hypothetical protein [Gemmatimonadota bacterium]NIQ57547.1 hypothetical protein [Gemmatimonadota bacterium]NIU77706.1 hypothetical protein [Gammaproteobacteria bacterium]NIX23336.1 hypothetical protein [Actinomycetota bacterium]NIX46864.1 hypothetical protein [Gemmatimonadota bacterium]
GLDRGLRVNERSYASPFDFGTQAVVAVPMDLPGPRSDGPAFDDATARVTAELAEASDGGIFVLFTSYRS